MMDISTIAAGLEQSEQGIWIAKQQRQLSYPHEGNELCFAVEQDSFWFDHRNDIILQLVRQFSSRDTFVDIGGGNGHVAHALQEAGIEVVLVEPGPAGASNAKRRGIRTIVQAPLEDAGFAPGSLPSAGLFDVLEHIEDDAAFLRTIHSYLQPQGHLYITVPAYRWLWSADDAHAGHFRRYTAKSLRKALTEAGFQVRYCSYFFSFLVLPILLLRSLPSCVGFRTVSSSTMRRDHAARPGLPAALLRLFRTVELSRIGKLKRMPFGSSCIAVATKAA